MSADLDRALARTVLIDDLPAAMQCQPDNGILVAPFFPANDIGAAAAERRSRADMESRHLAQKGEAADIVRGEAALEEVLALLTAAAREADVRWSPPLHMTMILSEVSRADMLGR